MTLLKLSNLERVSTNDVPKYKKKIWIMSGVGFRSKVVTEVTELQVFVDGYNRGTTKRSVEDYGGKFVRAFYVGDEMVGGYSLNQEQPFFHIDMIPTEELKSLPIQYSDICLLYTSPSPRDRTRSRMPSSA